MINYFKVEDDEIIDDIEDSMFDESEEDEMFGNEFQNQHEGMSPDR